MEAMGFYMYAHSIISGARAVLCPRPKHRDQDHVVKDWDQDRVLQDHVVQDRMVQDRMVQDRDKDRAVQDQDRIVQDQDLSLKSQDHKRNSQLYCYIFP